MNQERPEAIPYIPLTMQCPNLLEIPDAPLPAGYEVRTFRRGDETAWARIECAAGEFKTEEEALQHFRKEFGEHLAGMEERCLFITDEHGDPIGTTTAWYGEFQGAVIGRIHWVAVVPEHQGKKLSKPLLSQALRTMARFHEQAYLTTQTTSYKAVGMYLNYGFIPVLDNEKCEEGWRMIGQLLNRTVDTGRAT